jgi:hypothetical protein
VGGVRKDEGDSMTRDFVRLFIREWCWNNELGGAIFHAEHAEKKAALEAFGLDLITSALETLAVTEAMPNGAKLDVIRRAYGWTVDNDWNVMGLTAGDHGFEETGIQLDAATREALDRERTLVPPALVDGVRKLRALLHADPETEAMLTAVLKRLTPREGA